MSFDPMRCERMPPPFVKKTGQVIHYYYAKLVIAPSAGQAGNYRFIIDRYKALESGEIQMSNYNRELWLKEIEPQSTCAYCGGPGPLVADHVIPRAISGPDAMHNILRVCADCNSTKSDRDLIEWWDTVLAPQMGAASEALPRLAAGVFLKLAYDWHRVQNTLETPAHGLRDLQPFRTAVGSRALESKRVGAEAALRMRSEGREVGPSQRTTKGKSASQRESESSSASFRILDLILGNYLYKEDVQQLLEDLDLATSGSKEDLIARLLRETKFDPREALKFLNREGLEDLCKQLGLPTGGLFRGSLEERLLAAIVTERRMAG
jgi:hypothetical protein